MPQEVVDAAPTRHADPVTQGLSVPEVPVRYRKRRRGRGRARQPHPPGPPRRVGTQWIDIVVPVLLAVLAVTQLVAGKPPGNPTLLTVSALGAVLPLAVAAGRR